MATKKKKVAAKSKKSPKSELSPEQKLWGAVKSKYPSDSGYSQVAEGAEQVFCRRDEDGLDIEAVFEDGKIVVYPA